jgi:hypothetical protein
MAGGWFALALCMTAGRLTGIVDPVMDELFSGELSKEGRDT